MQEGDSVVAFMTKIKAITNQLLNIDEVILDHQLVSKVFVALPDLYQDFAITIMLYKR